jgi:hypothetical protein
MKNQTRGESLLSATAGSPSLLTPEELATLNPGIRHTVQTLREWGFLTLDSGDGETHQFECDRECPYVVIRVAPEKLVEESHRLMDLLEDRAIRFDEPPHAQEDPEGWAKYPRMESIYLPMERMAIIDVSNVIIPENSLVMLFEISESP